MRAYGWGLDGETLLDPSKNNNLGSQGEFGWAGAGGYIFFSDNSKRDDSNSDDTSVKCKSQIKK